MQNFSFNLLSDIQQTMLTPSKKKSVVAWHIMQLSQSLSIQKKKEKTRLDTPWIIKCGQEEEEFVIVHSHIFFNINGLFMVVMGNDTQEFNVV